MSVVDSAEEEAESELTPNMTPQVDMFGGEKCITPINCSSSLGDRLRNRGKEFHILK